LEGKRKKNAPIKKPNIPESFNVLIKELQAIGLDVGLLDNAELEQTEWEAMNRYEEIIKLEKSLEAGEEIKADDTSEEPEMQEEKAEEIVAETTQAPVAEETESEEKPAE